MITSKKLFVAVALLAAGSVRAQLNISLKDVDLAYPSISAVTLQLGGTTRTARPTPFAIDGLVSDSLLWFCMDPLQTIFFSGSNQPSGSKLGYESDDPANFDKWTALAPGLSIARQQNLADLFRAFAPSTINQTLGGALQLAVWEIVNEFDATPFSLAGGQMRVSGNTLLVTTAQSMLDSLDDLGVRNSGNIGALDFLIDGTYWTGPGNTVLVQDLLGYNEGYNTLQNLMAEVTPVPESGSFAFGIGGLSLLLIGWKLRQRVGSGNCLSVRSREA